MATLNSKVAPAKKKTAATRIKVKQEKALPTEVVKVKKAPEKKEVAKSDKEILKEEISATLQETFPKIKKAVGKKKFNKHVKKATKALAGGAAKKMKKHK